MRWQWWQTLSAMALAVTSSPNTFAQPPIPDVGRDHGRSLLVAGAHQLKQQVGAALVDIEVAQFVDDEQLRVRVVLEPLLRDPARLRVPQVVHEPRAVYDVFRQDDLSKKSIGN